MDHKPLNLAIVGCGNIARAYGKSLQPYPQLKLLGATDHILKLAEDYVATFGRKVYPCTTASVNAGLDLEMPSPKWQGDAEISISL